MSTVLPFPLSASNALRRETQRARDVAAYEAMRAARPRKPPPLRQLPRVASAAELALRADRRAGICD